MALIPCKGMSLVLVLFVSRTDPLVELDPPLPAGLLPLLKIKKREKNLSRSMPLNCVRHQPFHPYDFNQLKLVSTALCERSWIDDQDIYLTILS